MAERGRGRKNIAGACKVYEHKKMRISCYGCEIFASMTPNGQISAFRPDFALLHSDHENIYAEQINLIENFLGRENPDKNSWEDLQLFGKCCKCKELRRNDTSELRKALLEILKPYGAIVGKRNIKKLHETQEKLFDIGAWPLKSLSPGITQRPYWNEKFSNRLSEEEAKLILFFDYKMDREVRSNHLNISVDLDLPFKTLVDSFKRVVKEKQAEHFKELHGEDKRLNLPDFEKWDSYILAYTLKVKGVRAGLFNPKWPNKKLSRPEIADLLFAGEEKLYRLQKLDRYVKEAKKLIKQAIAFEGPFKMYGSSTFFASHFWQQWELSEGTLYRNFPFVD